MLNTRDRYRKIQRYLNLLYDNMRKEITPIEDIKFLDCEYKENNEFPDLALFKDLDKNGEWGSGNDSHAKLSLGNAVGGTELEVEGRLVSVTNHRFLQFVCLSVKGIDRVFLDLSDKT
jgi:hypothetical protein